MAEVESIEKQLGQLAAAQRAYVDVARRVNACLRTSTVNEALKIFNTLPLECVARLALGNSATDVRKNAWSLLDRIYQLRDRIDTPSIVATRTDLEAKTIPQDFSKGLQAAQSKIDALNLKLRACELAAHSANELGDFKPFWEALDAFHRASADLHQTVNKLVQAAKH